MAGIRIIKKYWKLNIWQVAKNIKIHNEIFENMSNI